MTPVVHQLTVPGGELSAWIAPGRGGELAGLALLRNGRWNELLYHGRDYNDTDSIASRGPVLWPAVGRNFPAGDSSDSYGWIWQGRRYPMPIHGFARQCVWQVVESGRTAKAAFFTLCLTDSPDPRRDYPFAFRFTIRYVLEHDSLRIEQHIHADRANRQAMPFSIGNHLTFNIPLIPGSDARQVSLASPATVQVLTDSRGRPTGELRQVSFSAPRPVASMTPQVAVSLSGYGTTHPWVTLRDPTGVGVRVSHNADRRPAGVPVLFNLWGDAAAGY